MYDMCSLPLFLFKQPFLQTAKCRLVFFFLFKVHFFNMLLYSLDLLTSCNHVSGYEKCQYIVLIKLAFETWR